MRNQTVIVVAAVAVAALALGGAIGVVAFNAGTSRTATPVAQTKPAATPRPTVTVTKSKVIHKTVPAPPRYHGDDADFLAAIARDGIKAPDGWAIEAGRTTCGTSYSFAHQYLTDGGLYSYHVQAFLDDWLLAHGGC